MAAKKPNILIIWGDDIGWFNVSAYNTASWAIGPPTSTALPRKARCSLTGTASRAVRRAVRRSSPASRRSVPASPRSGCPAPTSGCSRRTRRSPNCSSRWDTSRGQFGKNHLGDRDEFLPTVHGFDEFFGNLYHLNAEQEPECPDYPKRSRVQEEVRAARRAAQLGECRTARRRSRTPARLTTKRMETVDEEFLGASLEVHRQGQRQDDKPFFVLVELDAHAHLHAPEEGVEREDRTWRLSRWHGRARRSRRTSCSTSSTSWASPTTPS